MAGDAGSGLLVDALLEAADAFGAGSTFGGVPDQQSEEAGPDAGEEQEEGEEWEEEGQEAEEEEEEREAAGSLAPQQFAGSPVPKRQRAEAADSAWGADFGVAQAGGGGPLPAAPAVAQPSPGASQAAGGPQLQLVHTQLLQAWYQSGFWTGYAAAAASERR
eukprot:TRINITY_DN27859_c0_g1_i1.p2 TRINITY_DN27859_c0_g1~~TRINITY_DN27859_c0_g1_i1.p2  ORF type:complete len:184 (+),score=66.69 TRINITY_DN27859_c0_g1_i1:68-553(+)